VEGDISSIKQESPEYSFLMIEFETEEKANKFSLDVQKDLDVLSKDSPFRDFNLPLKSNFYKV